MKNTMLMIALCALALPILSACEHIQLPTSAKLDTVRSRETGSLTMQMQKQGFTLGAPLHIRIYKEERILETWLYDKALEHYRLFKTYPICSYSGTLGHKRHEGDKQAPEGFYDITAERMNPWSQYHLSMNIGYPNRFDQSYDLNGSLLMIHGGCKSQGCYAMGDPAIEEIYLLAESALAKHGGSVAVHIFPFRMNEKNMAKHQNLEWSRFWQNLKTGHDLFQVTNIPPKIHVSTRHGVPKYVFQETRKRGDLLF